MSSELPPSGKSERDRIHGLLERYGWNATSFQTLGSGFRYWFDGEDACVGYVDTGRAWIAAGAPVASAERMAQVALRFVETAAHHHRRASFFATEPRFRAVVPFRAIQIGEQPSWDPAQWEAGLSASASLREQLRRARTKGISIRELAPEELRSPHHATRLALSALAARWVEERRLPPMRFLVQLEPFAYLDDKRCWVAEHRGEAVGFLLAVPIYDRRGWLLENLLRDRRTPNGTTELLIDRAMRTLHDEGSTYVTLGLVPLAGPVGGLLGAARYLGQGFYDFEGLRRFKMKLKPSAWTPIFLSVPGRQSRALAIYDVLSAFAGRGLGHFGWRAIWTKPAFLAHTLAFSLLPWTAALALVGPHPWFPSAEVWAGWIAFDAFLIVALLWLARRWRRGWGAALASLIGADAATTLVEALSYNLPRTNGCGTLIVALAVLGPAAASVFLWHAALRRAPLDT